VGVNSGEHPDRTVSDSGDFERATARGEELEWAALLVAHPMLSDIVMMGVLPVASWQPRAEVRETEGSATGHVADVSNILYMKILKD
jgi:hypothetical protein